MLKYKINEDLILKLIQLYIDKNKTNILNKLLLHINGKSLNTSLMLNEKIPIIFSLYYYFMIYIKNQKY